MKKIFLLVAGVLLPATADPFSVVMNDTPYPHREMQSVSCFQDLNRIVELEAQQTTTTLNEIRTYRLCPRALYQSSSPIVIRPGLRIVCGENARVSDYCFLSSSSNNNIVETTTFSTAATDNAAQFEGLIFMSPFVNVHLVYNDTQALPINFFDCAFRDNANTNNDTPSIVIQGPMESNPSGNNNTFSLPHVLFDTCFFLENNNPNSPVVSITGQVNITVSNSVFVNNTATQLVDFSSGGRISLVDNCFLTNFLSFVDVRVLNTTFSSSGNNGETLSSTQLAALNRSCSFLQQMETNLIMQQTCVDYDSTRTCRLDLPAALGFDNGGSSPAEPKKFNPFNSVDNWSYSGPTDVFALVIYALAGVSVLVSLYVRSGKIDTGGRLDCILVCDAIVFVLFFGFEVSLRLGRFVVLDDAIQFYDVMINVDTNDLVYLNTDLFYRTLPSNQELRDGGCAGLISDTLRFTSAEGGTCALSPSFWQPPLGLVESHFSKITLVLAAIIWLTFGLTIMFLTMRVQIELHEHRDKYVISEAAEPEETDQETRLRKVVAIVRKRPWILYVGPVVMTYFLYLIVSAQQSMLLLPLSVMTPRPYCLQIDTPPFYPWATKGMVCQHLYTYWGLPLGVVGLLLGLIVFCFFAVESERGGNPFSCRGFFLPVVLIALPSFLVGVIALGYWLGVGFLFGSYIHFATVLPQQHVFLIAELAAPSLLLLDGLWNMLEKPRPEESFQEQDDSEHFADVDPLEEPTIRPTNQESLTRHASEGLVGLKSSLTPE